MKVPISWLKDYVDIDGISIEDLAHTLTMAGLGSPAEPGRLRKYSTNSAAAPETWAVAIEVPQRYSWTNPSGSSATVESR